MSPDLSLSLLSLEKLIIETSMLAATNLVNARQMDDQPPLDDRQCTKSMIIQSESTSEP
jgi:hypothetical protein